jgi:putative DNA primase/helicase
MESDLDIDADVGVITTILECQRCETTEQYYIPVENWPDGIECQSCERQGPFQIAGDGRVEFDNIKLTAVDLSGYEQITYEPPQEGFEPPEKHHQVGSNQYMAEGGDVSELNGKVELISAIHSNTLDEHRAQEQLPTWEDVKGLFDADANGSTTRGYNQAAKIINYNYDIVTIRKSGHVYFYDGTRGYYVLKGKTYINEIVNRHLGESANENRRREIRQRVIEDNYVDRDDFQPPKGKVCVENGVLDLETLELEAHTPEYYFTSRIQAEWPEDGEPDPRAEARWLQALKDGHDNKAEREKILRWVGYALETWHHDLEKNLFFVGYRRSGKSTIQEAIQAMFGGPPTVVNISPQQLADTRFDAGQLRDAALNTVNDINATKIENSGLLKRIWSGESIKIEDKHKDAEFAAPNAKHLFTANWLPHVTGSDEAIFRRIMIIEFLKKVSKDEEKSGYKRRLKRADVQQAILVTAARARLRLRADNGPEDPRDHFPADRDANETRKIWDSWRDAHKRFLYLQFEVTANPEDTVEKATYWQSAHEFADRNGWQPKGPRAITQSLSFTPGVYTPSGEEHYGGLQWRDVDAAQLEASPFDVDEDTTDTEDAEYQGRLTMTQEQRVQTVHDTLEDLLENSETVARQEILREAENRGVNEKRVKHIIQKLLDEGVIYEPENGKIGFT